MTDSPINPPGHGAVRDGAVGPPAAPATPVAFAATAVLGVLVMLAALSLPVREPLYRSVAGAAAESPQMVHELMGLVSDPGVVLLGVIGVAALVAAGRIGRDRLLLIVSAAVGTIAAYGTSEAIKLLVTEERPCRAIGIDTVSACPEVGDWSWPSNHATIAAGYATACVLAFRRLWPLVVPIALLVALARVAVGVHYVHDVLSGAALGILVTVVAGLGVSAGLRYVLDRRRRWAGPGKSTRTRSSRPATTAGRS